MNELIQGTRLTGTVRLDGDDIYARDMDVTEVRRRVGMVFPRSNPFPMTIAKNVAYGLAVAIVKHIMEEAGGSVGVESALGKGSTFTLRFPRYDPSVE